MKTLNILIDTNVLLDCVLNRNENHQNASKIIYDCLTNTHNGFMTSHSLCDFFYITRKDIDITQRKNILLAITSKMKILTEDNKIIFNTLINPSFFDLEDGLQIECAKTADLDYIITQNLKDFSDSSVPAISINEFAALIEQN